MYSQLFKYTSSEHWLVNTPKTAPKLLPSRTHARISSLIKILVGIACVLGDNMHQQPPPAMPLETLKGHWKWFRSRMSRRNARYYAAVFIYLIPRYPHYRRSFPKWRINYWVIMPKASKVWVWGIGLGELKSSRNTAILQYPVMK